MKHIISRAKRILVEHEWSRLLVPVIVGALLSAVPVLIAVYFQMESQRKDAWQARRMDVIAAYLRACNQIVNDGDRINAIVLRNLDRPQNRDYSLDIQELKTVESEMFAHWLEYKVQIDIINLMFEQQITPAQIPELSELDDHADRKAIEEDIEARKQQLNVAEAHCLESTKLLITSK
jgi:hypothetical protein